MLVLLLVHYTLSLAIYIYIYKHILYIQYNVVQDTTQEAIFVDISISQVIK